MKAKTRDFSSFFLNIVQLERETELPNVSVILLAHKFPFQAELIRDLISANRLYNSYHFGRRPSNATRNFQQNAHKHKKHPAKCDFCRR